MTAPLTSDDFDPTPYRALACAVLEDAVLKLRATRHPKEIAFFKDPARAVVWCEVAGFDYDALVSKLDRQGLFVAAPPTPKVKRVPKPTPTRNHDYQRDLKRRLLVRLSDNPEKACTVRELAESVCATFRTTQNALYRLKARGRADHRIEMRGQSQGATAIWWKVSS